MRYDDPKTRDALAAEYALGSLKGAARKRFETLANKRNDWQLAAKWWLARLHLLADMLPAITPRKQVWQAIERRLFGSKASVSRWANWWPGLALGSSGIAAALALFIVTSEPQIREVPVEVAAKEAPAPVALLADAEHKAAWMLTLAKDNKGQPELRMATMSGVKPRDDKSYELWILPPDKSAPISVGLMPQQGKHHRVVSEKVASLLLEGGLAVTLEPVGGAPNGIATGPVLYQGQLTQI
jgi:anti-sigma-K factor RskA